jgi:hypothetical protein
MNPVEGRKAELKDGSGAGRSGGGSRRDYGPRGCAGIVYGAAAATAVLVSLLKAVRR